MNKLAIALIIISLLALLGKRQPNALKIRYMGLTTIVRHPHPTQYEEGEMILYRMEDGRYTNAVVVRTATIDNELIDDELTAEEQAENIKVRSKTHTQ